MGSWPELFIVGAAKAGTTSLDAYLGQHPDIAMCPTKEPDFFSRSSAEDDPDRLAEERLEYLELFEDLDAPVVGETSPSYLWSPTAAERIHEAVPDARIVVSLRDPVERAYSHYLMEWREGREDLPFDEAIEDVLAEEDKSWGGSRLYVDCGRYADQLRRYLDRFGEDQVHVLLLDELAEDPIATLEAIARFLDVDPAPMADVDLDVRYGYKAPRNRLARWLRNDDRVRAVARALLPRSVRQWLGDEVLLVDGEKPTMDPATRRRLAEIYAPVIDEVEEMLGRSLPELRGSWPE